MAKVLKFLRNFAYAVAGFGLLILAIGTAEAAGALAVGSSAPTAMASTTIKRPMLASPR